MKYCLTMLLTLLVHSSFAQIEKGKWISSLGFDGYNVVYKNRTGALNSSGNRYDVFNSRLSGERMISKYFGLGLGLSYAYSHNVSYDASNSSNNSIYNSYGFGAFLTSSFFKPIGNNFYFSQNHRIGISSQKDRRSGPINYTYKTNLFLISSEPIGVSYLLNSKFIFRATLLRLSYEIGEESDVIAPNPNRGKKIRNFDYSLNPINNGISISYIFNTKKNDK